MNRRPGLCLSLALLLGCAATAGAATNTNQVVRIESPAKRYAVLAVALDRHGADLDALFQQLCARVLAAAADNPKLRLENEARAMFGGLWNWATNGARPQLQGQTDKALHFIGGGAMQGYFDAGRAAAVIKEELDRKEPHNFFDLDDMAATMLGARWVDLATTTDAAKNRQWLELWATGKCTLTKTLPKLEFGLMKPGTNAPPEVIQAIEKAMDAALRLPDPPVTP